MTSSLKDMDVDKETNILLVSDYTPKNIERSVRHQSYLLIQVRGVTSIL